MLLCYFPNFQIFVDIIRSAVGHWLFKQKLFVNHNCISIKVSITWHNSLRFSQKRINFSVGSSTLSPFFFSMSILNMCQLTTKKWSAKQWRVAEQQQWIVGATLLSLGPRWIVRNCSLLVAPSPSATYSAIALNFCMRFVPSHTPVTWQLTMFMDTNKGSS